MLLLHLISFGMSCFHFYLRYTFISLLIISFTHWLFGNVLFNFHMFVKFPVFLLLLISSFIPLWSENVLGMIQSFQVCGDLFYDLTYDLSWRMFSIHLRRMCVLSLLDRMLCICLLGPFGLKYSSGLMFFIYFLSR